LGIFCAYPARDLAQQVERIAKEGEQASMAALLDQLEVELRCLHRSIEDFAAHESGEA
jgi:hypothetical protein